jgi:orotate phosphoribosyltransferase
MREDPIDKSLQDELLKLLKTRRGHFRLESGHHGNLWLDLDLLFLHPKALQPFVVELARNISSFGVEGICGPLIGGALIAQTIALELGVDFLHTERIAPQDTDAMYSTAYRLPQHLHAAVHGRSIAIVDDVINAGSAVRGTLAELESRGAKPAVIGALLILGNTGRAYFIEKHIPVVTIAHVPNEVWKPEECPLCAFRVPLERPD